ncbi:MAG TPA: ParA family protein [Candidatus Dojkabacteria bacterium]|nr:ParA family protein [Candidatus Dojkabacteria bacterium]
MIITVTNQKGGVGKTTTTINIGVYLAQKNKKVLLVDMDPQANLTSGVGFGKHNQNDSGTKITNTIYDVLTGKKEISEIFIATAYPQLFLVPSGIELAGAEVELVSALSREAILRSALEKVRNDYDFILIDCPPSLGLLTVNSLVAADQVFIPVQCEYFALEGLSQLLNTIKLIKTRLNNTLDIGGVILTMYDTRTKLSHEVAQEIKNFFKEKVFQSIIPRNVRLSEAPSHGKAIIDYDPNSQGALAYQELTAEIIKRSS